MLHCWCMRFKNRVEAGQKLAAALGKYKGEDVVVYAIPRGGVVLGYEIAKQLEAPLDLVIPRKVGHPLSPEYAVCVVAEDGEMLCNEEEAASLDKEWLQVQVEKERKEAQRRRQVYLGGRPPLSAQDKIAILVDDGVATGLTFLLALRQVRRLSPKRLVAAIPVAPRETAELLRKEADELVVLHVPRLYLGAVGAYYDEFEQAEDEEVIGLLNRSKS